MVEIRLMNLFYLHEYLYDDENSQKEINFKWINELKNSFLSLPKIFVNEEVWLSN